MRKIFVLDIPGSVNGMGPPVRFYFTDRTVAVKVGESGYCNSAMRPKNHTWREGGDFSIREIHAPETWPEFLSALPASEVERYFSQYPDAEAAIRASALSKLTIAERKALGL